MTRFLMPLVLVAVSACAGGPAPNFAYSTAATSGDTQTCRRMGAVTADEMVSCETRMYRNRAAANERQVYADDELPPAFRNRGGVDGPNRPEDFCRTIPAGAQVAANCI